MTTPLQRATKEDQYDLGDLQWAKEGRSESTRTGFFWEYLEPYAELWKDKAVLDIGAGTGWLVSHALEKGAAVAIGIEPSEKNIAQGQQDHPGVELVKSSLEAFDNAGQLFDEIVAVMSFPHIADLDAAFKKIRSMLTDGGEVLIVVPDYEYFKTSRHGYGIEIQDIDQDQYAIAVTRESGTLADIVRRLAIYAAAAKAAGLELIEEKAMMPTETQMKRAPKYASVKDKALTHLMRFRINESS